jgi:hypothetical protein
MDINKLLRHVKRKCGLRHFETGFSDDELKEIIIDDALDLFSKYVRPYVKIPVKITSSNMVPNRRNSYYIPVKEYMSRELKIMDMKGVDEYYDIFDPYLSSHYQNGYDDIIDGVINATIDSIGAEDLRFEFVPPNILTITNLDCRMIDDDIDFLFYVNMPENLSQIPTQMEHVFKELAVIEVKDALFNELDVIKNLNTPNGNIQLPIDKWSDMASARKEIEDQLKLDRIELEFQMHII